MWHSAQGRHSQYATISDRTRPLPSALRCVRPLVIQSFVRVCGVVLCCPGDVKSAITKGGGKPADSGSVMFNFMRQGQVLVSGADEDELFEAAIEAGADDVQPVFDEEGQPTSDFKVCVWGGGITCGSATSVLAEGVWGPQRWSLALLPQVVGQRQRSTCLEQDGSGPPAVSTALRCCR